MDRFGAKSEDTFHQAEDLSRAWSSLDLAHFGRMRGQTVLLRFSAVIKLRGINPYVCVDAKLATRLKENWRRPLPVLVRVNGRPKKPWRINMMPAGDGSFYLYLHETVRRASGTNVGDHVILQVSFDRAYRGGPGHSLPRWFSVGLEANRKAKEAWMELVPSRKKEILATLPR